MTAVTAGTATPTPTVARRARGGLLRAILHNRKAMFGAVLFLIFCVAAAVPKLFVPWQHGDPRDVGTSPLEHPSGKHWLGTTGLGQDVYAELVYSTRESLVIALLAGLGATILSVLIGVSAAYLGGFADDVLSMFTDIFLVLPTFPLIIVLATYAGRGSLTVVIVVLIVTGWSYGARQMRAQALSMRNREFLESARVRGERRSYIIVVEVLPTMTSLILANFLGAALYSVLTAAGLQFLGLGDPNSLSWGTMLYWAQNQGALVNGFPAWALSPGLAVALMGVSFALLNYAFDEISNPALRPVRGDVSSQAVLEVRDLTVEYQTEQGSNVAVDGANLDVQAGEFVGVVGESGCGKSTLLFGIAQLLSPPAAITGGSVTFNGNNLVVPVNEKALATLRWRDFSVVMQSAMNALNPVKSIGGQFKDAIDAHDEAVSPERPAEVMRLVGIDPIHLKSYPHQLSGGMRQRAMIAMALLFTPDLIIMDEPTSALDVVAQRSLMVQIKQLQRELGFAVIFVTHDMSLVSHFSEQLLVMYAGQIVEVGDTRSVFDHPAHPYSRGLLDAFPSIRGPKVPLTGIPGNPPDLANLPSGCRFHPRCPEVFQPCPDVEPELYQVGSVQARCLLHSPEHRAQTEDRREAKKS